MHGYRFVLVYEVPSLGIREKVAVGASSALAPAAGGLESAINEVVSALADGYQAPVKVVGVFRDDRS